MSGSEAGFDSLSHQSQDATMPVEPDQDQDTSSGDAEVQRLKGLLAEREHTIEELVALTEVLLQERERKRDLETGGQATLDALSRRAVRAEETVRMVEESLVLWERSRALEKHDTQQREQEFLLRIHSLETSARMSSTIAIELAEAEDRAEDLQRQLASEQSRFVRLQDKHTSALAKLSDLTGTPPDAELGASLHLPRSGGGVASREQGAPEVARPSGTPPVSPPASASPEHYNRLQRYKP
eukprot:TRINITY_DN19400_c0_g1_i1.p1 TRINITY_DN19400_c0_g1~~TRINITY_DN19400_c0_g1_i1.p1  ORF type:complete len:241 (+),score=74.00 TRINITY_DN19400_c0_g1_i1:252-974(+)